MNRPSKQLSDFANHLTEILIPHFGEKDYDTVLRAMSFVMAWVIKTGPPSKAGENIDLAGKLTEEFLLWMLDEEKTQVQDLLDEGVAGFRSFTRGAEGAN